MADIAIHLEWFKARILQDALSEATAAYWERRAAQFATVGTDDCNMIAENCRNHARLLRDAMPEPISEEVQLAIQEVT